MSFFSNKKKLLQIDFDTQIMINNEIYFIQVIFSNKKNSSVRVNNKTIIFRLSEYLSVFEAKEHFNSLLEKIKVKILKNPIEKEYSFDKILERGYFYFANEKYIIEKTKNRSVKLENNIFYVNYHMISGSQEKWFVYLLTKRYYQRTLNYIEFINRKTYDYRITGFDLKLVKSKWGHCTFNNKIMLNIKLLNAPIEILDYVIIHELSHIKYKDHSINFWKNVELYCPNYKNLRKYLKDKPPMLFEDEKIN